MISDIEDMMQISIHALREESDQILVTHLARGRDFNPRPPRGERPSPRHQPKPLKAISIHALREESDRICVVCFWTISNFNPRPPRGERHHEDKADCCHADFNPRPPRGERR